MARRIREYCVHCGRSWVQDWEDPPECPYCPGEPICKGCNEPESECTCDDDEENSEEEP